MHAIRGFTDAVRCELLHRKSKVHLTMVQMPALNTPQFAWCENKMPKASQPVPPIYDPRVAADAVYFAANAKRREVWVGASSIVVILGNKLLPGLGDWYLGRTGYASQQHDGPAQPLSPNLWKPQDGDRDRGAEGSFRRRARTRSAALWASTHKRALVLVGVGLAASIVAGAASRFGRRRSDRVNWGWQ
jgi:hypothetical protein